MGGRGAQTIFFRGKMFSCPPHIIENFMTFPVLTKRKKWRSCGFSKKSKKKKREVKRLLPFSGIFSLVPRRSIRYRSLDLTRTQHLPFPRRERRTLNVLRLTPNYRKRLFLNFLASWTKYVIVRQLFISPVTRCTFRNGFNYLTL